MNWIHTLTSQSATVAEKNLEIMKLTMETTAATQNSHRKKIHLGFFFLRNFSNVRNIALFIYSLPYLLHIWLLQFFQVMTIQIESQKIGKTSIIIVPLLVLVHIQIYGCVCE